MKGKKKRKWSFDGNEIYKMDMAEKCHALNRCKNISVDS